MIFGVDVVILAILPDVGHRLSIRQDRLESNRDRALPIVRDERIATLDHYLPKERYPEFSVFSEKSRSELCLVQHP